MPRLPRPVRHAAALLAGVLAASAALTVPAAAAGSQDLPGRTGLPLPRFVSLKAERINMRVGPGRDYRVEWMYVRAGLPVEVIQEYDNWRKIRDADGAEGWVFHSMVSGRRTAIVLPWDRGAEPLPVRASPSEDARIAARFEPGVIARVSECADGWCHVEAGRHDGWIAQKSLWGVYPDEMIDD